MSEAKISYVPLWEKYLEMFEEMGLEHEQIGKLVTMMMQYQFRGQEPEQLKPDLKTIWFFLKRDLDYARKQYMVSVENGKKGGRKKKKVEPEETWENPEEPGKTQKNPAKGNTITESKTKIKTISLSNTGTDTRTVTDPETTARAEPPAPEDPYLEFARRKEAAIQQLLAYK